MLDYQSISQSVTDQLEKHSESADLCQAYKAMLTKIQKFVPDHPQNSTTCSFCHSRHSLKISERSFHNFLSYLANTQTNKLWQNHNLLGRGNDRSIKSTRRALRDCKPLPTLWQCFTLCSLAGTITGVFGFSSSHNCKEFFNLI